MTNNLFDKEKNFINEIEVPNNLDDLINSAIKTGEKKLRVKNSFKASKILLSTFILFIIAINLSPSLSTIASNLPIIGRIAELLTMDKGLNNAIEEGLYQDINYEETINGITLKVSNIVGDYRSLYLEYLLEGIEKNDVRIKIRDKDNKEIASSISKYMSSADGSQDLNSCYEISLKKPVNNFIITFNVYENKESKFSLAEFKVDINLDDKFNVVDEKIEITNNTIETEVGDIVINKITSTKTRTNLEFKFISEEYDFMSFDNPSIIDENGNEYNLANGGAIDRENNKFTLVIESDLSKKKELTLKADGIYYARKDDRNLVLDVENLEISENNYNIEVIKEFPEMEFGDDYTNLPKNKIVLRSKETLGFQFEENEKIKFISLSSHTIEDSNLSYEEYMKKAEAVLMIEILTDEKLIDLDINHTQRDRTDEVELKIK